MGLHVILAASDSSWGVWTLNVLLVLVGLNLVILVHELGHFIVARLCGVQCEKFYVWFDIFGWKLLKFKRGETEYGLGILPLGGYVKMLGQEDNPARLKEEIERAKAGHPNPSEPLEERASSAERALYNPRSYLAKSVPQRMAIISAGVIMNVVFALVAAIAAYGLGVEQRACTVGEVFAGEAAWRANLRPGDRIEQIAGKPVERFDDLQRSISVGDIDHGVTMVVLRPGEDGRDKRLEITLQPDRIRVVPTIGVSNGYTTELREPTPVVPGSPAALARPAFLPGDRIVGLGDVPVSSYAQIHTLLARHRDEPLRVTVERTLSGSPADVNTARGAERRANRGSRPRAVTTQISIDVAPAPMRRVGLVMEMGPITAIQDDSPAARAGIRPGDRILGVEGQPVGDPITLPDRMRRLAQEKSLLTVTVSREAGGEPIEFRLSPRREDWWPIPFDTDSPITIPVLGIAYRVLPKVRAAQAGSPAARAGLKGGEVIARATLVPPDKGKIPSEELGSESDAFEQPELTVRFDRPEVNWGVVVLALQEMLPRTRVELELTDGRTFTLAPVKANHWHRPDRGFLFEPLTFTQRAHSIRGAIGLAAQETGDALTLIFRTLKKLGTGQVSPKGLSGPVGIAQIAFMYASRGVSSLLIFLCLISANLAVINVIPIPVLDGGHMLFLTYEGIRGKPPSEGVLTTLTFGGLILILTLMVWVTGLDISRLFGQ